MANRGRRRARVPATVSSAPAATIALAARVGDQRFVRGFEPCSDDGACGAEHQRGGQPAAVADAACSQHRHRTGDVDDSGHERQGRAAAAVAARFGPLRHDDVRADVERATGFGQVGDLNDDRDACRADGVGERARDRRTTA